MPRWVKIFQKNLNLNDDFSESEGCDVQEDRLSDVQEEGSIPF